MHKYLFLFLFSHLFWSGQAVTDPETANANQDLAGLDGPWMNECLDRLLDRWLLCDKILMA